jgi:integrase
MSKVRGLNRHTHATLLIENGTNMKDVQERLGHSRLATTMDTYTHVTEKMSNDTVEIFERVCHQQSN